MRTDQLVVGREYAYEPDTYSSSRRVRVLEVRVEFTNYVIQGGYGMDVYHRNGVRVAVLGPAGETNVEIIVLPRFIVSTWEEEEARRAQLLIQAEERRGHIERLQRHGNHAADVISRIVGVPIHACDRGTITLTPETAQQVAGTLEGLAREVATQADE